MLNKSGNESIGICFDASKNGGVVLGEGRGKL